MNVPNPFRVIYLPGRHTLNDRGLTTAMAALSASEKRRSRWLANPRTIKRLSDHWQAGWRFGDPNPHMYGLPLVSDDRVPDRFVWLEIEEEGPITITYSANMTTSGVARPFKRGDTVILHEDLGRLQATVVDHYQGNLWQIRLATGKELVISDHALQKFVPKWQPGDVVVVQFNPYGQQYTYVRGYSQWPGESTSKTDKQIDSLYLQGKARPVLQQGGHPFDLNRLRAA